MKETFDAMNYIFNDVIENGNVENHFKRLKVLNFVLTVLKKLCRMQKIVQVTIFFQTIDKSQEELRTS